MRRRRRPPCSAAGPPGSRGRSSPSLRTRACTGPGARLRARPDRRRRGTRDRHTGGRQHQRRRHPCCQLSHIGHIDQATETVTDDPGRSEVRTGKSRGDPPFPATTAMGTEASRGDRDQPAAGIANLGRLWVMSSAEPRILREVGGPGDRRERPAGAGGRPRQRPAGDPGIPWRGPRPGFRVIRRGHPDRRRDRAGHRRAAAGSKAALSGRGRGGCDRPGHGASHPPDAADPTAQLQADRGVRPGGGGLSRRRRPRAGRWPRSPSTAGCNWGRVHPLVAQTPGGTYVLLRGNPFTGGLATSTRSLTTAVHGGSR